MKIKNINKAYEEVMALPRPKPLKPIKQWGILAWLVRFLSYGELKKAKFTYTGKLNKKDGPYLVLMNHSSFIDLRIIYKCLKGMPFSVVCTHDALVGKEWLMRHLGCFPTRKFVSDMKLIHDMKHSLKDGSSVVMFPEAGYTFDGTTTTLPRRLGRLLKLLDVPVAFIETKGAFARDPLYNGLNIRKVPVSADISILATQKEVRELSVEELDARIDKAFSFDNFAWQRDNKIAITEENRADGLERILYLCPHCLREGGMKGEGTTLKCSHCGKKYTLTEYGQMQAQSGYTEFSHIPDWYNWQRKMVKQEILEGRYSLDTEVDISMMVDYKALYNVGKGRLVHTNEGFTLTGYDGKLSYTQGPLASHCLNSDYFWYEIGDVIGIGDSNALYYCFTPEGVSVTKARLAAEELYKLHHEHYDFCHICDPHPDAYHAHDHMFEEAHKHLFKKRRCKKKH